MRRTKQVQDMVDFTNGYLKINQISDQYQESVWLVTSMLMAARSYRGFRWMKEVQYTDVMGNIEYIPQGCDEKEAEYIEIL